MESYCMICGNGRDGIEIKSDYVIEAIRWFNRNVRKISRKNRVVVCRDDYQRYKSQRKRYVSRQRTYIALGVIFMLMGFALSNFNSGALLPGIAVLVFLYLLSLLNYTPDLEMAKNPGKAMARSNASNK